MVVGTFQRRRLPSSRRTIPIPPSMLMQLKEHQRSQAEERMKLGGAYQNHDLVFATAIGGPLSIQNFTMRHFKPTLKRVRPSRNLYAVLTATQLRNAALLRLTRTLKWSPNDLGIPVSKSRWTLTVMSFRICSARPQISLKGCSFRKLAHYRHTMPFRKASGRPPQVALTICIYSE